MTSAVTSSDFWNLDFHLNVSGCEEASGVDWSNAPTVLSVIALVALSVTVIAGNGLVIAAVATSAQLRSATHLFISSLAVADLLVGLAVLPFSATLQLTGRWQFGRVWCSVWLAVDVWACTASILNLCAISLDRYLAISRPVLYLSMMSTRRARLLCALVWLLAFIIALPPLIARTDNFSQLSTKSPTLSFENAPLTNASTHAKTAIFANYSSSYSNFSDFSSSVIPSLICPQSDCALINERGYVIYSAFGSFFLPCFVMLFFYWRIYRVAAETSKAIRQGFRTVRRKKYRRNPTANNTAREQEEAGQNDFEEMTIRIHRGGTSMSNTSSRHHIPMRTLSERRTRLSRSQHSVHEYPSASSKADDNDGERTTRMKRTQTCRTTSSLGKETSHNVSTPASDHLLPVPVRFCISESHSAPETNLCSEEAEATGISSQKETVTTALIPNRPHNPDVLAEVTASSPQLQPDTHHYHQNQHIHEQSPDHCQHHHQELQPPVQSQQRVGSSRLNLRCHARRFRVETRAAKTLAIIIGVFILCWLPFFTMYLLRPFCSRCVADRAFDIAFWLGYCNSAMNPALYACFSAEFRTSFRRILCRVLCCRQTVGSGGGVGAGGGAFGGSNKLLTGSALSRNRSGQQQDRWHRRPSGSNSTAPRKPFHQVVISLQKLCESDKSEAV